MAKTPFFDATRLRIIGHRGAAGMAPENTFVSFEQALADGADAGLLDIVGRVEIGLARAQADHVAPRGLHFQRLGGDGHGGGRLDALQALGEKGHGGAVPNTTWTGR